MRVAIVGSRMYTPLSKVVDYVNNLPEDTIVVSGGAIGVDSTAALAAKRRGLVVTVHLPDWTQYGRSAGFKRNQLIVDDCDMLAAFWDGTSKGTANSIDLARKRGVLVEVYD